MKWWMKAALIALVFGTQIGLNVATLRALARGPSAVRAVDDPNVGVTCWITDRGGINCLPHALLQGGSKSPVPAARQRSPGRDL